MVVPKFFWKPKSLDQKKELKRLNEDVGGNYRRLKGKIGRVKSYTVKIQTALWRRKLFPIESRLLAGWSFMSWIPARIYNAGTK